MSRIERKKQNKVTKVEKSMILSVIFTYISLLLYFANSNLKFFLLLSVVYSIYSLVKDHILLDKSERIFN